ncbi:Rhodanese-related sulfurtransferase [Halogranum amylolyticum]|uniref:Rhodanese-related sulfurtransferase n=1 Tax=Halogranum amylolyticum TaxID=660520 RepID=A0A1H8TRN3_9EURY|nr:rhodanese-like domain-containing protein [Halogranum amylolyticum]SEO93669.1 Rhodanese-related sulfurtransferase [Halogranum amylolyticum]
MDGEISPEEVEELLRSDAPPRIVDIRQPASFSRGHIPGSENVPFNELPNRIASLEGADHIVTVCPHGQASVQAARLIKSYEGTGEARVDSMAGGLDAWSGDLETDVEQATADEGPDAPF